MIKKGMLRKITYSLDEVERVAKEEILPLFERFSVLAFHGPLGAGKTTLVKAVLKAAGVKDEVTSPTFAYVNRYSDAQSRKIYHFDLYRLDTLEQFLEFGFDEHLYEVGALSCIEWPDVIGELLSEKDLARRVCDVEIAYVLQNSGQRRLTLEERAGSS